MNKTTTAGAIVILLVLAGCTMQPRTTEPRAYTADIRWTSHGIPHIKAWDWRGAGYGMAYAVATDAICVLADEFVTVRGERARYFGEGESAIDSDVFHRAVLDDDKVEAFLEGASEVSSSMLEGYVAGYNRFITEQRDSLPAACREEEWVKPITREDLARLSIGVGIRYGLGRVKSGIANAAPTTASAAIEPAPDVTRQGSNALAFGRALTATGRGVLLGNPHYPWHGPSRFHMAHVTIPGELDVMGVGLITTPNVAIGFNRHVAWTHTVSTALRFTLFRLDLAPEDPMRYRLGDGFRDIEARRVTIDVAREDGSIAQETRTVYFTHLGPVVSMDATPWDARHVYAIRDVNYENDRGADQYIDLNRAENVADIKRALAEHQGVSFVNTIAADREGGAFYADMSAVPFVSADQVERCRVPPERIGGGRVIVLDGSRTECDWQSSPEAAAPGLMPPDMQPSLTTDTFVSNSNDSHWLTNPNRPLEGYSPIIGDERTMRSLRTRAGLVFVDEVLDRREAITPDVVQSLLFSHRHYGAELLLDDILEICAGAETTLDVAAACGILEEWDRRQDVDSRGAHIYNELWSAIEDEVVDHLAVPFDPEDPVATPRGLTTDDPQTRQLVIGGIETALARLADANVLPMARWGDVQFAERGGEKIGIPGGDGGAGMYSVIYAALNPENGGYSPIITGNSYVQVVTWREDGTPDARAILTYSQSPQPESPWYADQTRLYSKSEWIRLPFSEDEIEADMVQRLTLTE